MIREDLYLSNPIVYAVHTYTVHPRLRGTVSQQWRSGRMSDCLTNDMVPRSQRHAGKIAFMEAKLPQWTDEEFDFG